MKFTYTTAPALVLAATLAWAAPAAATVGTSTLCGYLKAAIADGPKKFATITDANGVTPAYFPADAANCGGGEAQRGQWVSACFWILPGADEKVAKTKLDALNQAVGACVGPSYKTRRGAAGGLMFIDETNTDRLVTHVMRDRSGGFQTYVMVAGLGAKLK